MPDVGRGKTALQGTQHPIVLRREPAAVEHDFPLCRVILPALPKLVVYRLDQPAEKRKAGASRNAGTANEEHFSPLLRRHKSSGKFWTIWGQVHGSSVFTLRRGYPGSADSRRVLYPGINPRALRRSHR